ncbi:ABATE domain-containing protein [Streptomyces sp. NPDC006655]|uniref:CGNR zinc finger domain-containing protein n=1 Tax=Streptomyces sp. NPDC006655 TaxID=3156898 RepID=UPI003455BDF2
MDAADSPAATPMTQVPGEGRHVALALVNTEFDRPQGPYDGLGDAHGAIAWLTERGLVPPGVAIGERERERLCRLRHSLRKLLDAHVKGTTPDPTALSALNKALATAPAVREVRWEEEGAVVVTRHPGDDALDVAVTVIAEDGVDLLTGPPSGRLAVCGASGCTRLFVRNHGARRWCSDRCGNRVRAARHYLDHRSAQHPPA